MAFSPAPSARNRRAAALFGLTIILPCTMLVVVGVRSAGQEAELAGKRSADDRVRQVAVVRQAILQRLEAIRLQAAAVGERSWGTLAEPDTDIVFAARFDGQRMEMPWDGDSATDIAATVLNDERFATFVREGERAEFVDKRQDAAVNFYRRAERIARHDVQRAYAKLLMARALAIVSPHASRSLYEQLAATSRDLRDEHGVPIAYYAAQRLVATRAIDPDRLFRLIDEEVRNRSWLAPPAAYLLKQLSQALVELTQEARRTDATGLRRRVLERVERTERALDVERDLELIRALQPRSGRTARWMAHADSTWLVTMSRGLAEGGGVVIAVDTNRILEQIAASEHVTATDVRLAPANASSAIAIDEVPGLRVMMTPAAAVSVATPPAGLYALGLSAVLGFALFGGYLLWRDTQRELRLADLRAQFVANVSHELKTPLTAIRMFAETLGMDRQIDPASRADYLNTIVIESDRLSRLLDTVLDFSKIDQNRKTYHLEPQRLSDAVHASADALRHSFAQQGFTLALHVDQQLPPVAIDADAIKQAIINLLSNAVKYSGASRSVDLRLERRGDEAVIEVTDRGIGVPAHEHRRIFEKFYRVPTPDNRAIPGTGLGLGVVQHVVAAHNGRIEVQSAPGQGSTFSIWIPLPTGDASNAAVSAVEEVVTPS